MRDKNCKQIYENFDEFLEEFIINKNSVLTKDIGVFTEENINKCIDLFIKNADESKDSFEDKVRKQFKDANKSVRLVFAHANWLWAMAVCDMNENGKIKAVELCLGEDVKLNEDVKKNYFKDGVADGGTYHKQNKYKEIVFNIRLFEALQKNNPKDINECKKLIEDICIYKQYMDEYDEEKFKYIKELWVNDDKNVCAMCNILLHLSYPEEYEAIVSNGHKQQLVESFESLLEEDKKKNIDEKIKSIRSRIKAIDVVEENFKFYNPKLLNIWNPTMSDKTYSEYQALKYKKAVVLYGPPGTSKTYSAKKIAESFIIQQIIAQDKEKVKEYLEEKENIKEYIHHLQLHNNYTYEDFIAGMQLKNGQTEPSKGYFLKICESMRDEKDRLEKEWEESKKDSNRPLCIPPHVLILDEINRIDISRLFGELFSGIENREETIDLSIGDFKIKVPDNLYIIGTMNEIDFSLEQIDFALHRRFVWFFYGFDEDMLNNILKYKMKNYEILKHRSLNIEKGHIEKFKENVKLLNSKIRDMDELGKEYEIGHAFFGEIIDIACGFEGKRGYKRTIPLFKTEGPAEVLWNISIKPIIEAFLGNLDKSELEEKLNSFKGIFLNGKN